MKSLDKKALSEYSPREIKKAEMLMTGITSLLVEMIMEAINSRDSDRIIEIAKAVKSLRYLDDATLYADRWRAEILACKETLDKKGQEWPIRKLANHIKWDKPGDAVNGYSQLRRLCKELKFPLADSKQISREQWLKSVKGRANKRSSKS